MACIPYVVMMHLSEQVRLIELQAEQVLYVYKTFTGNSQNSWTAYLSYENASLSSQVLCGKQYISMYFYEWLSVKKMGKKIPQPKALRSWH